MTAVPNDALTAATQAYRASHDTRGGQSSHGEALRDALVAAAPYIVDANPDRTAYLRGKADGFAEAYGIVMLHRGPLSAVLADLHRHHARHTHAADQAQQ